jgi:hypothetical protein
VSEKEITDDGELKKVTWELPLPKTKDERTGSIYFQTSLVARGVTKETK